jgi:hypothetical protein
MRLQHGKLGRQVATATTTKTIQTHLVAAFSSVIDYGGNSGEGKNKRTALCGCDMCYAICGYDWKRSKSNNIEQLLILGAVSTSV